MNEFPRLILHPNPRETATLEKSREVHPEKELLMQIARRNAAQGGMKKFPSQGISQLSCPANFPGMSDRAKFDLMIFRYLLGSETNRFLFVLHTGKRQTSIQGLEDGSRNQEEEGGKSCLPSARVLLQKVSTTDDKSKVCVVVVSQEGGRILGSFQKRREWRGPSLCLLWKEGE